METHVQLRAPAALALKKDPLTPIKQKSEHKKLLPMLTIKSQ
jgi:hypothetical protein